MSHQGLKSYVHQVSQARRSYQTRLEILSRGNLNTVVTKAITKVGFVLLFQNAISTLAASQSPRYWKVYIWIGTIVIHV